MAQLFNLFLYKPLLNALVVLYTTIGFGDLGISIILLTVLVRVLLYPLFHKMTRHQTVMNRLQPEIKRLQELHKSNKEKQTRAMLDLYKEHNINPFSSFFLVLLQLPILIALYQILLNISKPDFLSGVYSFITPPQGINATLLGFNLSERSILMLAVVVVAQYIQARMSFPKVAPGTELSAVEKMSRRMVFLGPVITIAVFYNLPAAVGLYWLTSTVFSIFQQIVVNKHLEHVSKPSFVATHRKF